MSDRRRDDRLHRWWTPIPFHFTFQVSQGVADQYRSMKTRIRELAVPGKLAHGDVEHGEPSLPIAGPAAPTPTGLGTFATPLVRPITRAELQVTLAIFLATYRRWFVMMKGAPLRLRSGQLAVAVAANRTNCGALMVIIMLRVMMQLSHRRRGRRRGRCRRLLLLLLL